VVHVRGRGGRTHHTPMMVTRLRGVERKLTGKCPTCDAAPGQRCISLASLRSKTEGKYLRRINEPHRERW